MYEARVVQNKHSRLEICTGVITLRAITLNNNDGWVGGQFRIPYMIFAHFSRSLYKHFIHPSLYDLITIQESPVPRLFYDIFYWQNPKSTKAAKNDRLFDLYYFFRRPPAKTKISSLQFFSEIAI